MPPGRLGSTARMSRPAREAAGVFALSVYCSRYVEEPARLCGQSLSSSGAVLVPQLDAA